MKMIEEVPKFIELRGCINCDLYKRSMREGFQHETAIGCVIFCGVSEYNYSITNPFIDPEEIVKKAKETGRKDYIENARRYTLSIKEKFRGFYEKIGVNLDELLEN